MNVGFHDLEAVATNELRFVVIGAEYEDQWIVVRHEDRTTWEIPGGHIEPGEATGQAARRELFEETGASEFELTPVCGYYVDRVGEAKSRGRIYHARIEELAAIPDSEIAERELVDTLPADLTYPDIQPKLLERIQERSC